VKEYIGDIWKQAGARMIYRMIYSSDIVKEYIEVIYGNKPGLGLYIE
jgi:hypothetical protein